MGQLAATFPAQETPTRVRYGVLGFVCSLSMITYLDRVCFGAAGPLIVAALGLTSIADLKWAFTAFAFAYAAFEVPTGWLGDKFGPRNTLIRIVLWWSFFTAVTGLVGMHIGNVERNGEVIPIVLGGVGTLVFVRFLFGIGEAGAYPNITRALHNWLPFTERGFGQGAVWMSGRLMGGLTPLVWALLVVGISWEVAGPAGETLVSRIGPMLPDWRSAFWLFGGLGLIWCLLFWAWFRNRPTEKPGVNAAEMALINAGRSGHEDASHTGVPWLKLLTNLNLWTLCLMYFCAAYGWYFNITYLHTFLEQQYDVSPQSVVGAIYKGGPLWLGDTACLIGGLATDAFIRRTGNLKWGRRLFGVSGHLLCAVCYFLSIFAPTAGTFFLAISFAAFWNDMTMGSAWAACQDIGKKYAAIVAGCMNTVGNLGGVAAGYATGAILEWKLADYAAAHNLTVEQLDAAQKAAGLLPGYHLNFLIFAAVYVVGALLWLRFDATKPVPQE